MRIPLGLPQSSSTLAPTQQHILTAGAAVLGVCAFPQLSACIAITLAAFWLESKLRAQLRLTLNGEQVSVEVEALEPVKDAKLEKQRPGFTHEKAHAAEGGGKRGRDDEPEEPAQRLRVNVQ